MSQYTFVNNYFFIYRKIQKTQFCTFRLSARYYVVRTEVDRGKKQKKYKTTKKYKTSKQQSKEQNDQKNKTIERDNNQQLAGNAFF